MPIDHSPSSIKTDFYHVLAQTLQTFQPPGLVVPYLTPGTTDSRFFRRAGMNAYGLTPMLLDVSELRRIHSIDERVSTANLRWGIQLVLETLLKL
jgi:acetylornithine deacetylase/succinyl-diaminopimelate desuccinylase-like protein